MRTKFHPLTDNVHMLAWSVVPAIVVPDEGSADKAGGIR
jgi:hypothetical protein